MLNTNHYQIELKTPKFVVHQYDIEIQKKFPRDRDDSEKLLGIKRFMKYELRKYEYFSFYVIKIFT
jgi:hypothetical protein